jgi:signal transduction histidine kinase
MPTEQPSGKTDPAAQKQSRSAPIIGRAPLPIVELQGSAHIVSYVNAAFCRLLGKTREELVGHAFDQIVSGGNECIPILDRIYETGEPATFARADDSESSPAYWLYAMWPALDADERPAGVIIQLTRAANFRQNAAAINEALLVSGLRQHEMTEAAEKLNAQLQTEIAERKLAQAALQNARDCLAQQAAGLERLVVERTEKLRETIGELESFSYSVAHDMRAPLRGMQGFAHILMEDHAGQLDPEALNYLRIIANSATRMDKLIQDVLDYTRVLRADSPSTPVDLDRLVREIVVTYPGFQSPKAEIHVEGVLPRVLGHEGLLMQCVSNLLSNAVKFIGKGVTPRVRIWAEDRTPSTLVVWIEDNGIGIAPKDRDRVFRMFERANPATEFEGTGIGLTIVRKAAERMGGKVGVESELGQGSRFWLELRKETPGHQAAI